MISQQTRAGGLHAKENNQEISLMANAFVLPQLPYAKNALAPYVSEETIDYHYGKHHANYLNTLNKLVEGTEFADKPLKYIILHSEGALFNNAAQFYNHNYYWKCMTPNGGGEPTGELLAAIEATWGSFAAFKEAFTKEATGKFGSGWTWLVKTAKGELKIESTTNADTPFKHGNSPMLVIDVWEHAYYIDYRNARAKYVAAFLDHLVNWKFVEHRFAGGSCGCGGKVGGCACGCQH